MDARRLVRAAIDRLNAGDPDGFLRLCVDDAKFFVGGNTRISGDHDTEGWRSVAGELAVREGILRRDVIDIAAAEDMSWADAVVHDYVCRDDGEVDYHAVFEFQMIDGKISYFWIYVHEFDVFQKVWA